MATSEGRLRVQIGDRVAVVGVVTGIQDGPDRTLEKARVNGNPDGFGGWFDAADVVGLKAPPAPELAASFIRVLSRQNEELRAMVTDLLGPAVAWAGVYAAMHGHPDKLHEDHEALIARAKGWANAA